MTVTGLEPLRRGVANREGWPEVRCEDSSSKLHHTKLLKPQFSKTFATSISEGDNYAAWDPLLLDNHHDGLSLPGRGREKRVLR